MPPLASIYETQLTEERVALSIGRIIRVPVVHEDHERPRPAAAERRQHAFDWSASPGPGEILRSSTVKDLVAGYGLTFEDRGTHVLKGVPGGVATVRSVKIPS
jgi:hypothetical protein